LLTITAYLCPRGFWRPRLRSRKLHLRTKGNAQSGSLLHNG